MPYADSDKERTEEYLRITTEDWPLEPFLPMKKMSDTPGSFPDFGFLYREQLDTIYLGSPRQVAQISESVTDMRNEGGMAHLNFHATVAGVPPKEQLLAALEKIQKKKYQSLASAIHDGWVSD